MKVCYVRGRKPPWSEQVVFLSPYDPPPFLNAAKGDTPLETPSGFLGAEAPKRREKDRLGRGEGKEKLLRTVVPFLPHKSILTLQFIARLKPASARTTPSDHQL